MKKSAELFKAAKIDDGGHNSAILAIGAEQIREQLDRVLRSKKFQRAHRLRSLLTYVVDGAVRGQLGSQSKTARELFGKSDDFDPSLDPVVRVQFGRLRRALADYYANEGSGDPVIIQIPDRRYTPVFHDSRHYLGPEPPPLETVKLEDDRGSEPEPKSNSIGLQMIGM
jgi:hypothetical protein